MDDDSTLTREALELVLTVTRVLAAPFDLSSMLTQVTAEARRVLNAERASVWLLDAAAQELVLEVSSDLGQVRIPAHQGLAGACVQSRQLINVPDCYADPRFDPSLDRRTGYRTRCSLSVPLVDHEGVLIGVLQILNQEDGSFKRADELLSQALAAQCAIALSRARSTQALLEAAALRREVLLAQVVQRHSLPQALPVIPGYGMHAVFQPASLTGGDTYDLALLDQELLVVLGDATGHGIAPALAVTQMHAMLRMALRLGADLALAFRQVNDQLAGCLPDGLFVTAFIGLLDPRTHRLRFISGGQAPILHFQAQRGQCVNHRATSFPMGAMPLPAPRSAVELVLEPGDLLVLLSDGVYEYENGDGEQFGRSRVEALVHRHGADAPAALSASIAAALSTHAAGAPQEDDITMVFLKREA